MGQSLSSSANNQDQDGDVIMVDDSETNVEDVDDSEYNHSNQNGSTSYSLPHSQANRVLSQDHAQLSQTAFEHVPQNGSPRVLRMTPARRRRQLSSLHPFFPSATTINQTQIPLSRPLTRLQRLHQNSGEDVSLTPRQTDAISPNILRRSRTRSSSYNGNDEDMTDRTESIITDDNNRYFQTTDRSTTIDTIVNGNLDEEITRSNGSNIRVFDRPRRSSSNRGTSIHSHSSDTSSGNVSADISMNSSTAGTQTDHATASTQRLRRRVTRISARRLFNIGSDQENAVIEAERAANEGHDGSFESFLAALQRRRREASNRPANQTTSNGSISPDEQSTSSVSPRDDLNGSNANGSQQNENNVPNMENRNIPDSRFSRARSATSTSSNHTSARTTTTTGTQTPPPRSWIIYVLGGTYPSTHPLLTTPSLFSDNPTYEDMLLLSSLIGPARPPTTTQREIDENLPVVLYNENIRGVNEYVLLGNSEKCQVCLCDYVANDELRVLNCQHGFHRECIDKWLTEGSNKCPICRGIGVPNRENETTNNTIPTPGLGFF
ncbi:1633_t:CDS:2 [Diversispora eburnea]|uniref:1633_t:CDS:1 n=1 Tax=Diversispora eburnea TaxID=1213867 RepID=A0A9N9BW93_9GLOM|nr:1633_t:CDS:2 [Diversispora eburnea]